MHGLRHYPLIAPGVEKTLFDIRYVNSRIG